VLVPWVRDPHPDHVATARLALTAAERAHYAGELAFYEVWLPVHGTPDDRPGAGEVFATTVELDADARERKRRALYAHRSQTSDLIDDDPTGFRITADLAATWLGPRERLYWRVRTARDR